MLVNNTSMIYEHRQKGGRWFYFSLFMALLSITVFSCVLAMTNFPGAVFLLCVFAVVVVVFIWTVIAMSSLTVSVDNEYIRIVFGPCAFVKKFSLKDITDAKPVKTDFWDGWGIHVSGSGWIYNIAGYDAVEIVMKSGRHNRIGTDQPAELAEAIRNIIRKISKGNI